jgi:hypothetical protein
MSKPKPEFSMEQLIGELHSKVPAVDEGGARTEEICLALGLGETTVRKMLRQLKIEGRLEVVRRRIERVHGGFGEGDGETRLPRGRKVRSVPTVRSGGGVGDRPADHDLGVP